MKWRLPIQMIVGLIPLLAAEAQSGAENPSDLIGKFAYRYKVSPASISACQPVRRKQAAQFAKMSCEASQGAAGDPMTHCSAHGAGYHIFATEAVCEKNHSSMEKNLP